MKIALTYTGSPEKHQYYVDWLKAAGNTEVIKLSAGDNNLHELNNCDALVLSGGVDIHPKFYNRSELVYPNSPEKGFNEKRDEFEMEAFRQSIKNNMPVLGVCRGMQLINCALHGDLQQDLGGKLNKTHIGNPDKMHLAQIEKGTLLYDVVGNEQGEINSAHHQAINTLGEGLMINAWAPDGVIEGIEWMDKTRPFMLAIQWHPERMFRFQLEDSLFSKAIRDRFIAEVKNSRHI